MKVNCEKSKYMLFNFTRNHQFSTRLNIDGSNLERIKNTKLLGTVVSEDLSWTENTKNLVKKANTRLELLRKVASFNPPVQDLKDIYILFVRSILEQSAPVWHSGLTDEDTTNLERVQKSAIKIILRNSYKNYEHGLRILGLETLELRRKQLCFNFAKKCVKDKSFGKYFVKQTKEHSMKTRQSEKYKVQFANTERFKKSPIIFMQKLLNDEMS